MDTPEQEELDFQPFEFLGNRLLGAKITDAVDRNMLGNAEYKTEYYGDRVRKIDPAGKKRDFYSNSLGQLIKVIEDPGGLNYITEYTYDALGKLTVVHQKGNNNSDTQTRTFDYDSLGRLLEADNPEASDF